MSEKYKLNEDVIGANNPDFCRKLRIYPYSLQYKGLSLDNLMTRIRSGCETNDNTKVILTSFTDKESLLKNLLQQATDKFGIDSFNLLHIRYGIRYPFKSKTSKIIASELIHALSYHNRQKMFLPIYSVRQNYKDDAMNINTYFNIYIPLYDLHNYYHVTLLKNDIDNKVHYGYNIIQKTLNDSTYAIKLDSSLINMIYSDARDRYISSYKDEHTEELLTSQLKNVMEKHGISSVDELEKLILINK